MCLIVRGRNQYVFLINHSASFPFDCNGNPIFYWAKDHPYKNHVSKTLLQEGMSM